MSKRQQKSLVSKSHISGLASSKAFPGGVEHHSDLANFTNSATDEFFKFKGGLLAANAGIEDVLAKVEYDILCKETLKKLPDYNIESICQISYQVSHLKQTFHDLRTDDVFCDEDEEPVSTPLLAHMASRNVLTETHIT